MDYLEMIQRWFYLAPPIQDLLAVGFFLILFSTLLSSRTEENVNIMMKDLALDLFSTTCLGI